MKKIKQDKNNNEPELIFRVERKQKFWHRTNMYIQKTQ